MSELISQPAVRKRLGVSVMTLDRWRKRPDLNFPATIKIGDRVFFNAADIDAWISARTLRRHAHTEDR